MRSRKKTIKNIEKDYYIENLEKELLEKNYIPKHKEHDIFSIIKKHPGKHSKGLLKIINHPELIGVNDRFYNAAPEINFFHKNKQKGAVDVYIETKDNQYVIEYKCNDHRKNREKAMDQLPKAEKYLKIKKQINPNKPCTKLYVFGHKLMAYELTKNGFEYYTPQPEKSEL